MMSVSLLGTYPRKIKTLGLNRTCTLIFISALSYNSPDWTPKHSSTHPQVNGLTNYVICKHGILLSNENDLPVHVYNSIYECQNVTFSKRSKKNEKRVYTINFHLYKHVAQTN